ncbi:restriction endonuclease subunit S [Ligilactobacillus ruminis]|uniref:restriction endonuclease subunit S n=1 Tax=Ligilactobacillus ruminis TaxID=1623 RepID=UPI002658048B|nr:restriction endonuclease subunit S [Ligilactobacillus ruminis]WKB71550.1 restriction endonuclease subunit S [Ligilactobacillus ruminis]
MNKKKESKVVPNVRFKGFTDDWKQRKLGEITDVRDGTHDSPKYVQEGHPFITSKNVSNGFINYNDVQYVTDADYEEINKRSKVDVHDILMGMIGTIGNLALIRKEPDFAIKNVALIKYTGDVDYQYLYQALQASCVTNQLSTGMDGGTQKFVSLKKIRELDIPFPDGWEQRKIGAYFSTLDHLITLHQQKITRLIKLKKAMLEKMFPKKGTVIPEIRFNGFANAWEQRKLGELVGIYDGVHQTPNYQDSGIMFLSVENIATLKSEKYIAEEAFERDYKVYPEKGDILMTRIGDVGTTNVVETVEKVAFYVSLALLKPNGIDSYFLSNAMKTNAFQKGLRKRTLVTAIPQKINKDEIGKIDIFITNNDEEQKKIGEYFLNLDHLIALHQRKIDMLKKLKSACLSEMFI